MPSAPDPSLGDALAALTQAVREGFGSDAKRPQDLFDHGHDPSFLLRTGPLLEFLFSRYFRVTFGGIEHVPLDGPALIVANHSGGLPYDGAMLLWGIHKLHPRHRRLRPLVANFAFKSPLTKSVIARIGGVRAALESALSLLKGGDLVAVFPEGLKGIGKPFRERYRLDRFGRGGFIRMAAAAHVSIVPAAIVGAEEIHPVIGKLTRVARPLGLPYIPITPTFPWLGPLGLLPVPSKWTIQLGPPIALPPLDATASPNERAAYMEEKTALVRTRIESMLARILAERRSVLFG